MQVFDEMKRPTMAEVKQAICELYRIVPGDIEGRSRHAPIVLARHVFCFVSYRDCSRPSLHKVATACGGRCHTSIWHAIHKIESMPILANDLAALRARLSEIVLARLMGLIDGGGISQERAAGRPIPSHNAHDEGRGGPDYANAA